MQSESVTKLMVALTSAQSQFTAVAKTKDGQEGNRKFKYADLADVVGMVTPKLNAVGIFLSQPIIVDAEGNTRQTTRLQLGEEFIQTDGIKLASDTPGKNLGISVTYARRIDLNGLLGIAPDEDVDAPDLTPGTPPSNQPHTAKTIPGRLKPINPEQYSKPLAPLPQGNADDVFPPEMYNDDRPFLPPQSELPPDARAVAVEMENFKPLDETRNTQIQNRLKELVTDKTLDRRKLSLFLDREHDGKKQFDVSADQWERTIKKIEDAVKEGKEAITALMKGTN